MHLNNIIVLIILLSNARTGGGGIQAACTPSIFCRDRVPDYVWAPQAKRMHQIVHIDFENYIFSPLLRGHTPTQTPPVPTGAKVLSEVFFKNPRSAPEMLFHLIYFSLTDLLI